MTTATVSNQKNNALSVNRFYYLDFIRVFAIITVIGLHCICDYYVAPENYGKDLWYILSFANEFFRIGVPLFFMISGFLLLNNPIPDAKAFYKRRLSKILIPFIFYDIFYFLFFTWLYGYEFSVSRFFRELIGIGSAYHLWFIFSIAFMYLMIPFLKIIVDKCSEKMLFFALLIITFQSTLKPFINLFLKSEAFGNSFLHLTEDGMIGYLGYLLAGYLLGRHKFSKKSTALVIVLGAGFFLITPIISTYSVTHGSDFVMHGGYSLNHYLEAAAVFLIFKSLFKKPSKVVYALSSVSFGAYFIHVFVLEIIKLTVHGVTPSVLMGLMFIIAVPLSFLWGFAEKGITKPFKKRKKA